MVSIHQHPGSGGPTSLHFPWRNLLKMNGLHPSSLTTCLWKGGTHPRRKVVLPAIIFRGLCWFFGGVIMLTVEVGYGYIQSKYSETNPLLYHLTNPPSTYKPNVYPHRQLLAKSSSDRSERANAFKTLLFFFSGAKKKWCKQNRTNQW